MWQSFGDISLAYLLGLVLSLLFESPVVGLEKLIFQKSNCEFLALAITLQLLGFGFFVDPKVTPCKSLDENHTIVVPNMGTTSAA